MRVVHIIPTYYPATYWGGPIFSVLNLNSSLAALPDLELKVLTTNAAGPSIRDALPITEVPLSFPAGHEVYFTKRVCGTSVAPGLLRRLPHLVRWADVVHLSGTYSFPTLPSQVACVISRKPLVWTPHGALQATHELPRVQHKTAKRIWEVVCRVLLRNHPAVLHVTSDAERKATQARIPGVRAEVIPHGVEVPVTNQERAWRPQGILRALFIGRLTPQKGLDNLLRALAKLNDPTVRLQVCGTGNPDYVSFLQGLAARLGLNGCVSFSGHVHGDRKAHAFLHADICVVPSHAENFCMVVAEALAHGTPVIASRGTPWADVESEDCGLWTDNSPERLAEAIRRIRSMNLPQMGAKGRAWMQRDFSWAVAAQRMFALYQSLLMDNARN